MNIEVRVVVIGLGSMGKRRIRMIRNYDKRIEIKGIDTSEERRCQVGEEYGIQTLQSLNEVEKGEFDCAFIATSPLSHNNIIHECLEKNMHVFTEINLTSSGYDKNMKLADEKKKVLFLSSTFLYLEEICYIDNKIKNT